MRVVMLSKACYVAEYRKKLVALAAHADIELTLIAPPYWRFGARRAAFEPGDDSGYDIVIANPRLNGSFHLHFYPGLRRRFEALRPDLVHIDEEPYDLVTWRALTAARAVGAKALFFTWQNIERPYPSLREGPLRLFERRVFAIADAAIAGGDEAMAVLRRKGFARPIYVIPQFGVDTAAFAPATMPPPVLPSEGPFVIGFVGRLVPEKGILTLLRAASGIGGDWRLRLLGEGPLREPILAEAHRLGVADRVELRGTLPSSAMPGFYHQLHALALPSLTTRRWKEQFGRVLVEAMACGVPVVGSDSGEIPHVIGDAGLVFAEGDVGALRARLESLLADPSQEGLRAELAARGRARVVARYSHDIIAAATYDVYRAVIGGADGTTVTREYWPC